MTIAACTLIATTFTGSGGAVSERDMAPSGVAESGARHGEAANGKSVRRPTVSRSETACTYAQHRFLVDALRWYFSRARMWENKMGAESSKQTGRSRGLLCPRFLARHYRAKAHALRLRYERWRTLRDFEVRDGNRAWLRAVLQAQKPYPGTKAWLLSCSASEGGWGRWVVYGGGPYYPGAEYDDLSGGHLQFKYTTFKGFYRHAVDDLHKRGFRPPRYRSNVEAWHSAMGQALAGAWAYLHGLSWHWSGGGC